MAEKLKEQDSAQQDESLKTENNKAEKTAENAVAVKESQPEKVVYDTPTGRPDLDPRKKPRKEWTDLEKWFRFMHRVHHIVKAVLPFKKHGHKQYYTDGAYLVVGNHHSMLDVIPTACTSYRPLHFIAKQEIWDVKIGAWFCNKSDAFPVARDGQDVRATMKAIKLLRSGEMVAIYPEGTRNTSGEIFLPLKSGAASLAIKTRTPVIFVIQLSKLKPFRMHHMYYSEPFEFTQFYGKKLTAEDLAAADSIILEKMYECYFMLDEEVNGKKNEKKLKKELKALAKAEAKEARAAAKAAEKAGK